MPAHYKILIVDDHKDNLIRIVEMIEERFSDWEIFHAQDGLAAISIAEKENPDLIILDWEMPGLDGIETTRILKQKGITKEIPVIICTGKMTASTHLETALNAGAVDYIRKPIDKIELIARIQSMLLLSDSYKAVKRLNDYKNDLLSIIAHDLKNPIYTVKLLLDMLIQRNPESNKRDEILNGVRHSISSTFSLLENLLAWANNQRNKITYTPDFFPLLELILENQNLYRLSIENKLLNIRLDIPKALNVFADKNMISLILRNLLSNAIKFSKKEGEILIYTKSTGKFVEVFVQDNGVGIDNENLKKIIENKPGFSTAGTENETGSGIGLQLCNSFLKFHQSELTIVSQSGKGTVISFILSC